MVRGPAALLGATLVALTYFLVAGDLPSLGDGDRATLVAGLVGVGLIAAVILAVTDAGDDLFPLALLFVGSLLLVAGMDAAGAHASVSPFEAIVDAWSVVDGPTSRLSDGHPRGASELTFDVPSWGGTPGASSRLGVVDAIFLAMFAVWARRFGLRLRATMIGMVAGLLGAVVLSVVLDRAVPALPLMAIGYWLPNLDRFAGMFRSPQSG